jgi:hypothetical protein
MSTGIFILLALLIFVIFALGVWLFIIIVGGKEDEDDAPIIINFMSHKANGRFLGKEIDNKIGKDGRQIITLDPRDVIIKKKLKKKIKIEPVHIIVGKNKKISFAKGILSKDKNITFILPPKAEDLPENVKNTLIGKALMWATELQNFAKLEAEILREGTDRRDNLAKAIGDGELSKEFQQFTRELVTDFLETQLLAKEAKNKVGSAYVGGGMIPPRD